MPTSQPSTRHDDLAFPELTEPQIDRIRAFGTEEAVEAGTFLFRAGQRSVDFWVVLEGSIEILDTSERARSDESPPPLITEHHPHGFTGELDLFSGREILVSGRMRGAGRVVRVERERFRELITAEPDIGEVILRAFIHRRVGLVDQGQGGAIVIGRRDSADTLRLQRFLKSNAHPMRLLLLDGDSEGDARQVLESRGASTDVLPVIICPNERVLFNPTKAELGACIGLTEEPDEGRKYDVVVIGAGPAGLAAAVYAASEGCDTIVLEAEAPGGQAATSSKIENYLGFPTGLSGRELADRALVQAQKFGAVLSVPRRVEKLLPDENGYRLQLDTGGDVRTRTVVVATGARWRTLALDRFRDFEGSGIHYAATTVEADLCQDSEVIVVGGGNSAGQAAVFLAAHVRHVSVLIRSGSLAASMSDYLIQRMERAGNIELLTHTEVTALRGGNWLEEVQLTNHESGVAVSKKTSHIFLMIGALPNCEFLKGRVSLDERGFIITGSALLLDDPRSMQASRASLDWRSGRAPFAHETSLPGVFAVGDVRSGSVKRVASAVGEGSVCVADVHRVLTEVRGRELG